MMRCHICGRMLNTQDLGQYFNEVMSAHYYTVAIINRTNYINYGTNPITKSGHTEGMVVEE